MKAPYCQFVRESILAHLNSATNVTQSGDSCIATLPIPTLDGRLVDIFIETTLGDYFVVHDGGKAVNELILQGVKVTDSITSYFESIARRFSVSYADEMFTATVKSDKLQQAILAIGMCSALAIGQLISSAVILPEEPIREQFGRVLKTWAKRKLKVTRDVRVKGRRVAHKFDFLATPRNSKRKPIAMSVLAPGSNSLGTAQRFGFIASDLDTTAFAKWPKVAVETRAELWSAEARGILHKCADVVIEMPTDAKIDKALVEENLQDLIA